MNIDVDNKDADSDCRLGYKLCDRQVSVWVRVKKEQHQNMLRVIVCFMTFIVHDNVKRGLGG